MEWFQKARLTHERKPFMVTPAMSTLRREILRHSVRPVAASLSCQKGRSELVAVQTSSQAPPFSVLLTHYSLTSGRGNTVEWPSSGTHAFTQSISKSAGSSNGKSQPPHSSARQSCPSAIVTNFHQIDGHKPGRYDEECREYAVMFV